MFGRAPLNALSPWQKRLPLNLTSLYPLVDYSRRVFHHIFNARMHEESLRHLRPRAPAPKMLQTSMERFEGQTSETSLSERCSGERPRTPRVSRTPRTPKVHGAGSGSCRGSCRVYPCPVLLPPPGLEPGSLGWERTSRLDCCGCENSVF